MRRLRVLGKKLFSLSLIFNALLTIAYALGVLGGFFWFFKDWQPFYPYLVNGNVFLLVIVAAVLNIFPSARVGRGLKTGRFLFHHYMYGCLVLLFAILFVVVFTPVSLLTLFLVNNTSVAVNVGRFFILGGFTLLLDDLPDVSKRLESTLTWLKTKVYQRGKTVSALQLLAGAASLYVFVAVTVALSQTPQWVTLANFILICTVLLTSLTSFLFVQRRVWLNAGAKTQN